MNNPVKIVHFSVKGNKDKYFFCKIFYKMQKSWYRPFIHLNVSDVLKILQHRLFHIPDPYFGFR